jgi:hypothetical protein
MSDVPDELLLATMLWSWADREHPGDEVDREAALHEALTALYGGASLAEALEVGHRALAAGDVRG